MFVALSIGSSLLYCHITDSLGVSLSQTRHPVEVAPVRMRPHPYEFMLYYDC